MIQQSNTQRVCKINRISADLAENAILEKLDEVLIKSGCLSGIQVRLVDRCKADLKDSRGLRNLALKGLADIEVEISGVMKLAREITDGPAVKIIKEKLENLAIKKSQLERNLEDQDEKTQAREESIEKANELTNADILKAFWRGWKKAPPNMKKQLIRALFDKILVSENGMEAHYWVFSK